MSTTTTTAYGPVQGFTVLTDGKGGFYAAPVHSKVRGAYTAPQWTGRTPVPQSEAKRLAAIWAATKRSTARMDRAAGRVPPPGFGWAREPRRKRG